MLMAIWIFSNHISISSCMGVLCGVRCANIGVAEKEFSKEPKPLLSHPTITKNSCENMAFIQ